MLQQNIFALQRNFPHSGQLVWIGIRPGKAQMMLEPNRATINTDSGLNGDHYNGNSHKRQVTLFQQEHLNVLESLLAKPVQPAMLRRNLLIKGINLLALKGYSFQIGEAILKMTGICHPCSKMETVLGIGGYNAMRSHCGITAQVIKSGQIQIGDALIVIDEASS